MKTPQEMGRLFEKVWATLLGVKPQPGSGNQWFAKMDVADSQILWSLKYTEKESFSLNKKVMREVEDAVTGTTIPGLATSIDGEQYVTLRADDFVRLCRSGDYKYIVPTKAEQKRSRSKVPSLFREDDE